MYSFGWCFAAFFGVVLTDSPRPRKYWMLNGLAGAAATELSQRENPKGFIENDQVAS